MGYIIRVNMDTIYRNAIKAGLICGLILIVIALVTQLVWYWAFSQPSLQQWAESLAIGDAVPTTDISYLPPEGIILGITLIISALLKLLMFVVAGALSVIFASRYIKGIKDTLVAGSISGGLAQVLATPFTLLFILLQKLYGPYSRESLADTMPWLISQIIFNFTVMLVTAVVLSIIGALVSWGIMKFIAAQRAAKQ